MNDDADDPGPFPELDALGALRAAFKTRGLTFVGGSDKCRTARAWAPAAVQGYELAGEIARGGMGVIVQAFDRELTRDVALKVLRDELGFEPRLVRRFVEEARVTARLDHPGIVPVYQVGKDSDGRAYFAMRLVRGRDLRRIIELAHAGEEGWSQTRALSVMLKVCEAMAYAHQRGVIHRDLKPSNIMVGEFGEVYVMDWGLARVIGQEDAHDLRLSDRTTAAEEHGQGESGAGAGTAGVDSDSPIMTMDGEVLGTPCYMSPEQAQGRVSELGPRSDVYAVGAMLYHLLAGEMPYVPAGTSVASREVLARLVDRPPRALSDLCPELPGELVAICEKAMARDPEGRYASMLAMAEDLRAFLEGRVVRAYETGAWAEARKWVQRNRALASSLVAVVLALVTGLIASLALKAESDTNFVHAQENARAAEKSARVALAERDKAQKIASFLEETLSGVKASVAAGRDTAMLREMMDKAAARVEAGELSGAPEAEVSLMCVIGGAYGDIAQFDKAQTMLERALQSSEKLGLGDHALRATALSELGVLYLERDEFAAAEPLLRQALEMRERLHAGDDAEVAQSLENLAGLLHARGDRSGAEALLRRALEMDERLFHGDRDDIALNMTNLAIVLQDGNELAAAETLFRRSLAMRERLHSGDDPMVAASLETLAGVLLLEGDLAGAEPLSRRALDMRRRLYAGDHPDLAKSLINLGNLLSQRGDHKGAEPLLRAALEMRRRLFPGDHQLVAECLLSLAACLHQSGDLAGAEPLYRAGLTMLRRLFPQGHPDMTSGMQNLGVLLKSRGDLDGAEAEVRAALEMQRKLVTGDDPQTALILANIGFVLTARGDFEGAEAAYSEALDMRRRLHPKDHIDVARSSKSLAAVYEHEGDLASAEALYRESVRIFRSVLSASDPIIAGEEVDLARVLSEEKKFAEADALFADAERALARATGAEAQWYQECVRSMVEHYTAWEQAEPHRGHAERARAWEQKLAGAGK